MYRVRGSEMSVGAGPGGKLYPIKISARVRDYEQHLRDLDVRDGAGALDENKTRAVRSPQPVTSMTLNSGNRGGDWAAAGIRAGGSAEILTRLEFRELRVLSVRLPPSRERAYAGMLR